ncbi:MAG: Veg family protein [Tissierellia bacterium]|nr:Veg family protein [Tissierellia bacterium]
MNKETMENIKSQVADNIGRKVILKADKGRKRIVTSTGVIIDAFPSVFTVKINNDFDVERTVSYSYSDILTSTVKLQIC